MTMVSAPVFSIDGPVFTPPPYLAIRGDHYLQGFKDLVHNLGGDCRKILERHDIDPDAAEDPDYPLSCTTGAAMLEYCSRRFNDDLFGLHLADHQDADVFGCLTTLARSAPNLRTAIDVMVEYLPVLHSPGADIESVATDKTAEFRWHQYADIGTDEQSISHGLLLFVKFVEGIGGRDFRPRYVNAIPNVSRRHLAFMEDRFKCKVNAKASANAIAFDVGYFDRPLKTSNRLLFGLLKSYLSRVKNTATHSLEDRVEAYVRSELSSGECTLEHCAAKLGTTARTLHRHLAQKSITFSDVVEERRIKAAKRALLDTDDSLDDVAASLGYAEQSSFARAFKRWTNMTPRTFRDSESVRRLS